jgi:hypothetical protein
MRKVYYVQKPARGARVQRTRTNMKANYTILLMSLALGAPSTSLLSQDAPDQPQPPRRPRFEQRDGGPGAPREGGPQDGQRQRGPRPDGQGPDEQKPPVPPLIAALDANHDGVIDAKEIESASAALKTLDKNSDGKLTMEELRPPRPQGGDDQNGPRPRGQNFRRDHPDGPPPGDGQGQPRRPRPPGDQQ